MKRGYIWIGRGGRGFASYYNYSFAGMMDPSPDENRKTWHGPSLYDTGLPFPKLKPGQQARFRISLSAVKRGMR